MIAGRVGALRVLYLTQAEVDELSEGQTPSWLPSWALGFPVERIPPHGCIPPLMVTIFVPDGYTHISCGRVSES